MSQRDTELSADAAEIRRGSLVAIHAARSGHPGGALSCADILALLCLELLDWRHTDWDDPLRPRLVLSKGHAAPALYAAAAQAGLLPRAQLLRLRRLGHPLQGHPHVLTTPWAEASSGSLGQGFSAALGMALGLRHRGSPNRIFALLGDGELQEGMVWEAAMAAAHHRIGQLTAIVDYNRMQSDARCEDVLGLEPLPDKWRAFGWEVRETDGHDLCALRRALADPVGERPLLVLAHTVKGRGVRYMEGSPLWHGSLALTDRQLADALADLDTPPDRIEKYLHERCW